MIGLTNRQEIVLKKIFNFISEKKYPPTIRELEAELGLASPRGVTDHLKSLEKKGYIERNSSARSIRLTEKSLNILGQPEEETVSIPLVGRVAAGKPILAEENIEEYISVPRSIFGKRGADFALKVKGDSMIDDHIMDGDNIFVRSQKEAENGDIVVALIDDEAVVKRFYRVGDRIELRSSNPSYKTMVINSNLIIQGKVLAVYRRV